MAAGFRLVFTSFRDGKKHILNIGLFLYFYKCLCGFKAINIHSTLSLQTK